MIRWFHVGGSWQYDENDEWGSYTQYYNDFFSKDINETKKITLRIHEDYRDYYGDARIYFRIRESGESYMGELDFDEIHIRIGQNVAKLRKERGLSQLDLSLKIGHKSVSIVASAERYYKNKHFNINHLFKIAEVLEVDVCEFFKKD